MAFGVRRCDNRQVSPERTLNFLVKVIRMIMRQQYSVNSWQLLEVYRWICLSFPCHAGAEMNMIACMKEVRIGHYTDSFPLQNRSGGADEVQGSIIRISVTCRLDLGLFGQRKMLGMAVIGCAVADRRLVVVWI